MYYNQQHIIVSIADIHFGATAPLYMYEQLQHQFIKRLIPLNFDILAICGDIFDSKFMSNNPIVSYALSFMDNLIQLCSSKGATVIIIEGTQSHDNGQLSLFYHYMSDPRVDLRIVENIQFEYVKGMKILCIPEKYGLPEEEYNKVLFNSGGYDMCLLHGTYKGSFKGAELATLKSNHAPVFSMPAFINCAGPILMGHYHKNMCFDSHAYYNGSAFRFAFGEEESKGFLITIYNQYTRWHCTELVPIQSHKYVTININDLLNDDPKRIIDFIKQHQITNGIDFIRVQFNSANENMNIVRKYFRNDASVTLQELDKKTRQLEQIDQSVLEQNSQYSYIIDNTLDDYTKLTMYINQNENCEFITVEELTKLLEGVM